MIATCEAFALADDLALDGQTCLMLLALHQAIVGQ